MRQKDGIIDTLTTEVADLKARNHRIPQLASQKAQLESTIASRRQHTLEKAKEYEEVKREMYDHAAALTAQLSSAVWKMEEARVSYQKESSEFHASRKTLDEDNTHLTDVILKLESEMEKIETSQLHTSLRVVELEAQNKDLAAAMSKDKATVRSLKAEKKQLEKQ